MNPWDPSTIQGFLDALRDTDVEELRWSDGERRVAFRRSQVTPKPLAVQEGSEPGNVSSLPGGTSPAPHRRLPIKSPMVGTFHRSPSVEHPPFVIKGSVVTPGQKVGVIEAMKVMKDVVSPIAGRIAEIVVENGTPVEYGQDLFLVEPDV